MAGHISTVDLIPIQASLDVLVLEIQHDSEIFPDSTDRKVEFTAGSPENTWSAWAEIADDDPGGPVTLSSKITQSTHISGILIEDLSHKDKRYMLEIAYGDDKARVASHRFLSGEVAKLDAIQFIVIRADHIPAGEKVYYRMMCEQDSGTCEVSIRYHYHS